MTEPAEPKVFEKRVEIRAPRWLAPAWLMKRLGAKVEHEQTLEGEQEILTLEKEFRVGG